MLPSYVGIWKWRGGYFFLIAFLEFFQEFFVIERDYQEFVHIMECGGKRRGEMGWNFETERWFWWFLCWIIKMKCVAIQNASQNFASYCQKVFKTFLRNSYIKTHPFMYRNPSRSQLNQTKNFQNNFRTIKNSNCSVIFVVDSW